MVGQTGTKIEIDSVMNPEAVGLLSKFQAEENPQTYWRERRSQESATEGFLH